MGHPHSWWRRNKAAKDGPPGKTPLGNLNCAGGNTQNQLNTCFGYDAAGNMISNGTNTYTYDDENRITAAGGMFYVYDGDGERVAKCAVSTCAVGTEGTFYWKGEAGNTLVESDVAGNFNYEYIFFNGQRVARRDLSTNNVHYYFSDHLGSSAVVADDDGNVQNESDYSPYGEEMIITDTLSPQNYKFTGKERDSESGLDTFGFRYYGSSLGRFMKPDDGSGQQWQDPQTLNLYSYVRNSPLSNIDPDGHDCVYLNDAGDGVQSIDQSSSSGECGGSGGYWVQGAVTNAQISGDALTLTGTTNGVDNNTSASYSTSSDVAQGYEAHTMWYYMFHGTSLSGPAKCDSSCFQSWMAFHEMTSLAGGTYAGIAVGGGGEGDAEELMASRPGWASTPGGFVNWLKNLQAAGGKLTAEQADAVIAQAKEMGVEVRLDPPHPGTNWNVPHLNIGSNGQVHLEVPAGYSNPGVAQGHP